MYKVCFYVPKSHLDQVKAALFEVGAGRIGDYDRACWQTLGEGQFRPLAGSDPMIGTQGQVETVKEYKVEMVCDDDIVKDVVQALKATHPYEEPAYDVWPLASF